MTERDKAAFRRHLECALEHINTLSVWCFVAIVGSVAVRGVADQPWELVIFAATLTSGGMAGLNFRWAWQELARANAIAKRNRS